MATSNLTPASPSSSSDWAGAWHTVSYFAKSLLCFLVLACPLAFVIGLAILDCYSPLAQWAAKHGSRGILSVPGVVILVLIALWIVPKCRLFFRRLIMRLGYWVVSEPIHTVSLAVLVLGMFAVVISIGAPLFPEVGVVDGSGNDALENLSQPDGGGSSAASPPKPRNNPTSGDGAGPVLKRPRSSSHLFDRFSMRILGLLFGVASVVAVVQVFHLTRNYEFHQMDYRTFLREVTAVLEQAQGATKTNSGDQLATLRYICMVLDPTRYANAGMTLTTYGHAMAAALAMPGVKHIAILNPWIGSPPTQGEPPMPHVDSTLGKYLLDYARKQWHLSDGDRQAVRGSVSEGKQNRTFAQVLGKSDATNIGEPGQFQLDSYRLLWFLLCEGREVLGGANEDSPEVDIVLHLYTDPPTGVDRPASGFPNANLFLTEGAGLFALWRPGARDDPSFQIDGLPLRNKVFIAQMAGYYDYLVRTKGFEQAIYLSKKRA